MAEKPTVLVVGATGSTGPSIIDGLLVSQKFNVAAIVRPSSRNKQQVTDMAAHGVDIRLVDLANPSIGLREALHHVEILISAIEASQLHLQRPLIDAAKKAGVKRFVPCDWATACVRGVRALHDVKLNIHDYVKEAGLPYTFIDIGWWMQLTLPNVKQEKALVPFLFEASRYFSNGDVKSAVTDLRDIGLFLAKIIADPRTVNHYVFCYGEEVTRQELFAIGEKLTGETIPRVTANEADILNLIDGSRADDPVALEFVWWEYYYSTWIRGDNTIENAKKPEYGSALDARELYPDFQPRRLIDFANDFYAE